MHAEPSLLLYVVYRLTIKPGKIDLTPSTYICIYMFVHSVWLNTPSHTNAQMWWCRATSNKPSQSYLLFAPIFFHFVLFILIIYLVWRDNFMLTLNRVASKPGIARAYIVAHLMLTLRVYARCIVIWSCMLCWCDVLCFIWFDYIFMLVYIMLRCVLCVKTLFY